ncbi:MAG: SH3 domain-containing protein [Leptolyngbyaceae cyanobacterium bins.349]|nr:SH3 domain-containing protein [Leptolyngbyaceae cyanobacterium bins.349]
MGWSGFFRGFSAVVVAIALLLGGGFVAFQFVVSQFTAPPPRPTFPNDKAATPVAKPAAAKTPAPTSVPVAASPKPSPTPTPSPSPTNKQARITLGEGLNVRQAPSADAERVDGVDYNDTVTILEESPDQEWLKVRIAGSGIEGWIKSGYTEPVTPGTAQ